MKLIDKDTLEAKIRKRLLPVVVPQGVSYDDWECGADNERLRILALIDNLEVKEVDLEKEIKESIIDEWCDEWSGDVGNWIRCRRGTTSMTIEDVIDIAKHFFELGLKAQKGK